MTAPVILPAEAQVLTDDIRRDSIVWLARQCAEIPLGAVELMLARWAHESLDARRRAFLFADYRECAERASALRDGVADAGTEMPELTCDEPWLEAAYQLDDRAAEALYVLVNGEVKQ